MLWLKKREALARSDSNPAHDVLEVLLNEPRIGPSNRRGGARRQCSERTIRKIGPSFTVGTVVVQNDTSYSSHLESLRTILVRFLSVPWLRRGITTRRV